MPPKIRDLERRLIAAGFVSRKGKGSHRIYTHPVYPKAITVSGKGGDDAQRYQESQVEEALDAVKGGTDEG